MIFIPLSAQKPPMSLDFGRSAKHRSPEQNGEGTARLLVRQATCREIAVGMYAPSVPALLG